MAVFPVTIKKKEQRRNIYINTYMTELNMSELKTVPSKINRFYIDSID